MMQLASAVRRCPPSLLRSAVMVPTYTRGFTSSTKHKRDVCIIGGGPGGYVAALRAAQLGMRVTCVEKRGSLGGTCLNVGCIPSKCLLHSSELYHEASHSFPKFGIKASGVSVNLRELMAQKDNTVKGLTGGLEMLFQKNGIEYLQGSGRISSEHTVDVTLNGGKGSTKVDTENIIIATGSDVVNLPFIKVDEKRVVTSTGALSLDKVPGRMVVIGAGVIGLELGSVWKRLGSKVTFVEAADKIAPGSDLTISRTLKRLLEKQNLKFLMDTKVTDVNSSGKDIVIKMQPKTGAAIQMEADVVMVAVGRRPVTTDLGCKEMNIALDRGGRVVVNEKLQTNIPSIYAIGDVIQGPMLAHKAEEEGFTLVERLAGLHAHVNYDAIPSVIYTNPEVAWVGMTQEEAAAKKIKVKIGQFPMKACSRARCIDEVDGIIKVIASSETDKLLGAHIISPAAGELIAEATAAIEMGMTSAQLARVCHAHPTLSEALKEASLAVRDKALHL
ncbi:glycine cleavage system L1 protein, mitochondrial [Pelomyxa schiedti]|nr:glycine cleavage system L1 protein, mitochondrial [Pelomyxa schiedti]